MKLKLTLALVSLALSLPLSAATLTADKGVSILFINGKEAVEKIGENEVEEGFIQAVVKFDKKLGRGNSAKVFTSKPYVINFELVGSQVNIQAPVLYSESDAKAEFSKSRPNWSVLIDGQLIAFDQEALEGRGGFMPYSGIDELLEKHNKQRGVYFDNGELIEKPVAAIDINGKPHSKGFTDLSNVEQLKAWYTKANKEERKEFRRWMIDQD